MKSILCSAPGRICLFGDHMDWCGYQVIPAAMDQRIFLEGRLNKGKKIETHSFPPFTAHDEFNLNSFKVKTPTDLRYVRGTMKALTKTDLPYQLRGMTFQFFRAHEVSKLLEHNFRKLIDLPASKGLSSSAAMCVAIAAVTDLAHRFQKGEIEDMESHVKTDDFLQFCAETAYRGERKELGVNCGQMDPYASAYGGFLHIDCSKEPARIEKFSSRNDPVLVVGDTNQPKDTPRILAWLGERFQRREDTFMEGVSGIVKTVSEAKEELSREKPDLKRIGELMNKNQHYIANHLRVSGDCPISPSKLDQLIEAALDAGALGAKVTGSGGGGCMIALCESDSVQQIADSIETKGGNAMITKISNQGVRLEYVKRC